MMRKLEKETQPKKHFVLPPLEGPILPEINLGQHPGAEKPVEPATTPGTAQ
jgi:hypothetical protein